MCVACIRAMWKSLLCWWQPEMWMAAWEPSAPEQEPLKMFVEGILKGAYSWIQCFLWSNPLHVNSGYLHVFRQKSSYNLLIRTIFDKYKVPSNKMWWKVYVKNTIPVWQYHMLNKNSLELMFKIWATFLSLSYILLYRCIFIYTYTHTFNFMKRALLKFNHGYFPCAKDGYEVIFSYWLLPAANTPNCSQSTWLGLVFNCGLWVDAVECEQGKSRETEKWSLLRQVKCWTVFLHCELDQKYIQINLHSSDSL